MDVNEFDFNLPESLIAQTPLQDRTASRLLTLNKHTGEIKHTNFKSIIDYLNTGDTLVLNDTKVMPARLFGVKEDTGAKIEMLMLTEHDNGWEVLIKPAKRVTIGTRISFGEGKIVAICVEELDQGGRIMQLNYEGILQERLDELGLMPLPPYIKETLEDQSRYQTVYARATGSAAAPTAGLHFTESLLEDIKAKGINIAYITLHVGLGTFRPVSVDDVESHKMHSEYYEMSEETAKLLNDTRDSGNRSSTVGTTSTRTLETIADDSGHFTAQSGWTDIFIYPGYSFKAVDAMITNFHLPKSTLVMLVSSLATKEFIMNAYNEAVNEKYRFFSFGDAMFIY